jgi:hypothetical protein
MGCRIYGRNTYKILFGNLRERDNFRDIVVDGRILKLILKKWDVRV